MQRKFNSENWNTARYINEDLEQSVLVSMGASPHSPEVLEYCVTIMKGEFQTLSQTTFFQLDQALDYVNKKFFKVWSFSDLAVPKKSGSCSTCQAH